MNALNAARFKLVALVLVGLVSVMCLTSLAEASSDTYRGCAPANHQDLGSFKTSFPTLAALPVDRSFLLGPGDVGCSPADPTSALIPVNLWGDLSSRAPPTVS